MRDELTDRDSVISPASSSAPLSSGSGAWDGFCWPEATATMFSPGEIEILGRALDFCHSLYKDKYLPTGELVTQHIQGAALILASLRVDSDTLAAGILHAVPAYLDGYEEKLHAAFNPTIAHLVEGVVRMGRIRTLGPGEVLELRDSWPQVDGAGRRVGPGEYSVSGEVPTDGAPLRAGPIALVIGG